MQYIYHGVPPAMRGSTLYPLNQLRARHPDMYEREIAKYQDNPGRRDLPSTTIPVLNCLWNDVLHCASIHPHLLYKEWSRLREKPPRDQQFFRIPIDAVCEVPVAIMRGTKEGKRHFEEMDPELYSELVSVPPETTEWYEHLAGQGRFGAHFVGIPHVLIHGTINTVGLEIVSWKIPNTGPEKQITIQ